MVVRPNTKININAATSSAEGGVAFANLGDGTEDGGVLVEG